MKLPRAKRYRDRPSRLLRCLLLKRQRRVHFAIASAVLLPAETPMTLVVCRKGGSPAAHFTDGKVYPVVPLGESDGLYTVTDDSGIVRIILAGEPSGHLMDETGIHAVGTFHRAHPS